MTGPFYSKSIFCPSRYFQFTSRDNSGDMLDIQSLDISLGDCGIVRHARVSKGYLANG